MLTSTTAVHIKTKEQTMTLSSTRQLIARTSSQVIKITTKRRQLNKICSGRLITPQRIINKLNFQVLCMLIHKIRSRCQFWNRRWCKALCIISRIHSWGVKGCLSNIRLKLVCISSSRCSKSKFLLPRRSNGSIFSLQWSRNQFKLCLNCHHIKTLDFYTEIRIRSLPTLNTWWLTRTQMRQVQAKGKNKFNSSIACPEKLWFKIKMSLRCNKEETFLGTSKLILWRSWILIFIKWDSKRSKLKIWSTLKSLKYRTTLKISTKTMLPERPRSKSTSKSNFTKIGLKNRLKS